MNANTYRRLLEIEDLIDDIKKYIKKADEILQDIFMDDDPVFDDPDDI